jgi:hypothetical protein
MKHRRPFAAVVALVAFVFAQLLAAAYACEMGMAQPAAAQSAAAPAGDCCDPVTAPDAACHNHCEQANKAPERIVASNVAAPIEARLAVPFRVASLAAPPPPEISAPYLARHIEPRISIRNCCFRI